MFGIVLATAGLSFMDLAKFTIALPVIQEELQLTYIGTQLVVSGYLLAFTFSLLPGAYLGDTLSRRLIFHVGISGFLISSLLSGLAVNESLLVMGRLVQGMSSGLIIPQILGLIQTMFKKSEQGRAFALYGAVIGISGSLSPVLGGLLIGWFGGSLGWRAIFLFNVVVGLPLLFLSFKYLRSEQTRVKSTFDWVGYVAVTLLISCLFLLSILLPEIQENLPIFLVTLGLTLALMVLLIRWNVWRESKKLTAIFPKKVISAVSTYLGLLIGFWYFAAFPTILLLHSLYLQDILQQSALITGIAAGLFPAASAIISVFLSKTIAKRFILTINVGLLIVAIGLSMFIISIFFIEPSYQLFSTSLSLVVAGAGSGLAIASNQVITLDKVPSDSGSTGAAILQLSQRTGSTLGVAVVLVVLYQNQGTPKAHDYGYSYLVVLGFVVVSLVLATLVVSRESFRKTQH